jgi:uncharacterized glyoxalase superfamily protein PhnB
MKRLTPNLLVESIEDVLPFWEAMGFERTAEVPHGGRLGFVGLTRGDAELMFQSRASLETDLPEAVPERCDHSGLGLFVEIDMPFDDLVERIGRTDAQVLVPDRRTFYGAREIAVRTPDGLFVVFAAFEEDQAG